MHRPRVGFPLCPGLGYELALGLEFLGLGSHLGRGSDGRLRGLQGVGAGVDRCILDAGEFRVDLAQLGPLAYAQGLARVAE